MNWEELGFNLGYGMAKRGFELDHQRRVDAVRNALAGGAVSDVDREYAEGVIQRALDGQGVGQYWADAQAARLKPLAMQAMGQLAPQNDVTIPKGVHVNGIVAPVEIPNKEAVSSIEPSTTPLVAPLTGANTTPTQSTQPIEPTQKEIYNFLQAQGVEGFQADYGKTFDKIAKEAAKIRLENMTDDDVRAELHAQGYGNDVISVVLNERRAKRQKEATQRALQGMAMTAGNPMQSQMIAYYQAAGLDPKYLQDLIKSTTSDNTLETINTGGEIVAYQHDKNGFSSPQSASFMVTNTPYQTGVLKNQNQRTQAEYAVGMGNIDLKGKIAALNAQMEGAKIQADLQKAAEAENTKRWIAAQRIANAGASGDGANRTAKEIERWTTSSALSVMKQADEWDKDNPDSVGLNPYRDAADDAQAFLNRTGNYGNYDMNDAISAYRAVQDILEENYRRGYQSTPEELYQMISSLGGMGKAIADEYLDNGMLEAYGKTR